jgi:hypothetical protein
MNLSHINILWNIFKDSNSPYVNMDLNNEVISRLKFISKINKGEKINTQYMFVQSDTFLTSVSRTFYYKDNRTRTMQFLKSTIMRSFEILQFYASKLDNMKETLSDTDLNKTLLSNMYENLLLDISNARIGIVNLKDTYSADIRFCCDIDTLLQDMDVKLASLTRDHESPKREVTM